LWIFACHDGGRRPPPGGLPYGVEHCGVIRGIREIRGYDQPVSRSPSSRLFSSAGSTAARPAAAAHARLPGGLPEGERPSRTSGVGGLHEGVEHGRTGFLHPPDDPVGMAASGVRLLTDPDLHRSVAAAGSFGQQWTCTVLDRGQSFSRVAPS